MEGLNDTGKAMRGAKVLVCGVAYKPEDEDLDSEDPDSEDPEEE